MERLLFLQTERRHGRLWRRPKDWSLQKCPTEGCRKEAPRALQESCGNAKENRKWQSLKNGSPKNSATSRSSLVMWMNPFETTCLSSFVAQTGETQTRWKTWPTWLPGAEPPKKKRVWNACTTFWWCYPIELRIVGLRVVQIPLKRPHRSFFEQIRKAARVSNFTDASVCNLPKSAGP